MTPKKAEAPGTAEGNDETRPTSGETLARLSDKKRGRFSPVSLDGVIQLPGATAQAFWLASQVGKIAASDGTYRRLTRSEEARWILLVPVQRDYVLSLLEKSERYWRKMLSDWEGVRMAHRCPDLSSGSVVLFIHPAPSWGGDAATCVRCSAALSVPEERHSQYRKAAL